MQAYGFNLNVIGKFWTTDFWSQILYNNNSYNNLIKN